MKASRGNGGVRMAALILGAALLVSATFARPLASKLAHHLGLLPTVHPVHTGQPLGPLAFDALDGAPARISASGHPMLINIFATWCPPCQAESPVFARLAPKLQAEGIDVIGVAQAESGLAVERFARQYGLPYPLYVDPNHFSEQRLGAHVIPMTVLVDRHGVVRSMYVGPVDGSDLLAMAKQVAGKP